MAEMERVDINEAAATVRRDNGYHRNALATHGIRFDDVTPIEPRDVLPRVLPVRMS